MQMGNASQVAVLGQSRRNVLEANQKKQKQKTPQNTLKTPTIPKNKIKLL